MSRFAILLGGDLFRTPRVDAQVAGARVIAADSGMRHADDARRRAGTLDRRFRFRIRRTRRGMAGRAARGLPGRQGQDRRRARRRRRARAAARPRWCWPALLAVRAPITPSCIWRWRCGLPRQGLPTCSPAARRKASRCCPATRDFDFATGTLFSILGFSDLAGLSVSGARWPLDRIDRAIRLVAHHFQRGDAATSRIALGAGRALLVAHPYPAGSRLLTWPHRFSSSTASA